jgi:choline dehydrogenase-like flavoprotein
VQEALLPRAESTGHCTILADAMAVELIAAPNGSVSGCIFVDGDGRHHRVEATVVCVCCSAVESARLLLLSKSKYFPDGMGNGSGLVGKFLQFHAGSFARARFRRSRVGQLPLAEWRGFLVRSLMDYHVLPHGISEFRKGGVHIFELGKIQAIERAWRLALRKGARPVWGEALKVVLESDWDEMGVIGIEVCQDFIPNADTFVTLDSDVVDKWGLPVARIHIREPDHHKKAGAWLLDRGCEILEAMGATEIEREGVGYVNEVLVHGTCRAGTDRGTSVLNGFCQSHDVRNLFVVDGSYMPTSGAAPSTLTIMANSFRVADYIRTAFSGAFSVGRCGQR